MKHLSKIALIITAGFSLNIYLTLYAENKQLKSDNADLKSDAQRFRNLYRKCNGDRIQVDAILTGQKNKTLVYW